jgi:inosine/xanthosine triphosphatase
MMKVLVGSKNPVKITATEEVFSKYFGETEVTGIEVSSKVSAQPTNQETFEGAKNRALELKKLNQQKNLGADFFVGLEGGITKLYSKWFNLGVGCVIDNQGRIGYGLSPYFELPESIVKQLLSGSELGQVMAKISGEDNIRQKEGAIGFLSRGMMDRKNLYIHSLIAALVPFLNKDLYF